MKPRSCSRERVNLPVFPETLTSWMMSGKGSSLSDPWNAISLHQILRHGLDLGAEPYPSTPAASRRRRQRFRGGTHVSFDRRERPQREADSGGEPRGDAQRVRALTQRGELREAVDGERRRGDEHGDPRGALAHRRQQRHEDQPRQRAAVNGRAARADRHLRAPQREAAVRDAVAEEAEEDAPLRRGAVRDRPGADDAAAEDGEGDRGDHGADNERVPLHLFSDNLYACASACAPTAIDQNDVTKTPTQQRINPTGATMRATSQSR